MIDRRSISKEWIEETANTRKADKILVEKVIRALILLEGLCESGLPFIFKGGTALLLMFDSTKRLSIDIDIILPDKNADLDTVLTKICEDKGFLRYEKQERPAAIKIDKVHYQLFFNSEIQNRKSVVLLDILREEIHYQKRLFMVFTAIRTIIQAFSINICPLTAYSGHVCRFVVWFRLF